MRRGRPQLALSLFWRTFALLLLLVAGVFAWVQVVRTPDFDHFLRHVAVCQRA